MFIEFLVKHSNTWNFLTLLTFAKLLEIYLFDHLTVCIHKTCLQIIFNIYVKTGFGIE